MSNFNTAAANSAEALAREVLRLRDAITEHRAQKADDRCIEDDDRLYAALGDGIKCDRRVGDKAAMLRNCERFIERRCEAGGWPTYAELEAKLAAAEKIVEVAEEVMDGESGLAMNRLGKALAARAAQEAM